MAHRASYREFYRRSLEPVAFWGEQAKLIHWHKPFDEVLDYSKPPFARWFVGGETNLCYNAVDRHLAERAGQQALIYVSTETGDERVYTYRELFDEVNRVGGDAAGPRRRQGRPRPDLHADDPGGDLRDARVGPHRRHPLGGVRRLRRALARHAHRRRPAQGPAHRRRRHARRQGHALQAAPRRGAQLSEAPPAHVVIKDRRPRPRHGAAPRAAISTTTSSARDTSMPGSTSPGSSRRTPPTSSTPREPPASPRACSATPAATPSRSPRR